MTTAFSDIVVPQVAAFKANISAGSILVSTLSKGTKTTNGWKVVVDGLVALDKIAACIRGDSKTLPAKTDALREALQAEGRKGRYETEKLLMPAIMPAAQAPVGTAIKGLSLEHHNDLYGFDVDEQREGMDLAATRAELIAAPGAVMVGTSCAGDALFAIFAGPLAENAAEYKRHWEAITAAMPESAKANNGKASKNFNRLRFLAHDPDVWLADTVVPLLDAPQFPTQPEPTPTAPAPPARPRCPSWTTRTRIQPRWHGYCRPRSTTNGLAGSGRSRRWGSAPTTRKRGRPAAPSTSPAKSLAVGPDCPTTPPTTPATSCAAMRTTSAGDELHALPTLPPSRHAARSRRVAGRLRSAGVERVAQLRPVVG